MKSLKFSRHPRPTKLKLEQVQLWATRIHLFSRSPGTSGKRVQAPVHQPGPLQGKKLPRLRQDTMKDRLVGCKPLAEKHIMLEHLEPRLINKRCNFCSCVFSVWQHFPWSLLHLNEQNYALIYMLEAKSLLCMVLAAGLQHFWARISQNLYFAQYSLQHSVAKLSYYLRGICGILEL